nr:MAG TPA: hypothetical protein [Caudoviricetes sp.]
MIPVNFTVLSDYVFAYFAPFSLLISKLLIQELAIPLL